MGGKTLLIFSAARAASDNFWLRISIFSEVFSNFASISSCRVKLGVQYFVGEFPTVMRKSVDHVRDFVVPRC